MTLDHTKTATPCELIAHLLPAVTGNLWNPVNRWHGRQHDGTWKPGDQHSRHLQVLREALSTLPATPRWDRFRYLTERSEGQRQALRWLTKAREGGYLPRPHDYPTPDRFAPRDDLGCLCRHDCWRSLHPRITERPRTLQDLREARKALPPSPPAVDLPKKASTLRELLDRPRTPAS